MENKKQEWKNSLANWNKRFLKLAKEVASWSKDPSKQVGVIYVGENRNILATGYNGFPRGIEDSDERLNVREDKYKYVVHAEQNGIYNACLNGQSLKNSIAYVYGLPVCSECTKALIQVGVKEVHQMLTEELGDIWIESSKLSQQLFDEVGIRYYFYDYE